HRGQVRRTDYTKFAYESRPELISKDLPIAQFPFLTELAFLVARLIDESKQSIRRVPVACDRPAGDCAADGAAGHVGSGWVVSLTNLRQQLSKEPRACQFAALLRSHGIEITSQEVCALIVAAPKSERSVMAEPSHDRPSLLAHQGHKLTVAVG